MKTFKLIFAYGLILATAAGLPAHAQVINGSVTNLSAASSVAYTEPASVTLSWSMTRVGVTGDPGLTVSSTSGRFTSSDGSVVLGTVQKTLSLSRAVSMRASTFTFTETVNISREILFKAYKQGIRVIAYQRDFTDCPTPPDPLVDCSTLSPTLSVSFAVTGSSGGAFTTSGLKLRFTDGSIGKLIHQNERLRAYAEITVRKSGTMQGAWEIATPATTTGMPAFRSLQRVSRLLIGGQSTRLDSPYLPSSQTGIYLVRFRIIEPAMPETPPVVQYNVLGSDKPAFKSFGVKTPADNAQLDRGTRFEWETVSGASGYKLFFVDKPPVDDGEDNSDQATTGIMLKSKNTRTGLNASLRKKLQPGRQYWWQVQALDEAGNIIAKSKWRVIRYKLN